jgi:hypothetical protein
MRTADFSRAPAQARATAMFTGATRYRGPHSLITLSRRVRMVRDMKRMREATGGYIRLYNAEPGGYTNGVWRAEGEVMRHLGTFTPLSSEDAGPPVRPV